MTNSFLFKYQNLAKTKTASYNLRIIQEYFQPKIGRKIRIFSLGRENNILIKKKSVFGTVNHSNVPTKRSFTFFLAVFFL